MPSSSSPPVRALRRPPADFDALKIPCVRQPGRSWYRVHQARHSPVFFSVNPNHRFSHPDCPYKLLYVGMDLATCLFERFGDEVFDGKMTLPESLWRAHSATQLRCPALHVCDLTNPQTLAALMVDHTALLNEKLEVPQAWGLAIQRHPAGFQGIKYKSRFNGRTCLVLFGRDDVQAQVRVETSLGPLEECDPAADWLTEYKISLY